ncbi:uncharacterized protein LOC122080746 [Macadamia integrifolia]|uniref:uncharacterized protein LOC122080746 n=1 Tax=Macadamia integrifolia TaxID=60698 RepID=UPI001C4FDAFD|nr:uncharacterized protein LOC122080746 [Macadamia integrifolia]
MDGATAFGHYEAYFFHTVAGSFHVKVFILVENQFGRNIKIFQSDGGDPAFETVDTKWCLRKEGTLNLPWVNLKGVFSWQRSTLHYYEVMSSTLPGSTSQKKKKNLPWVEASTLLAQLQCLTYFEGYIPRGRYQKLSLPSRFTPDLHHSLCLQRKYGGNRLIDRAIEESRALAL